MSKGWFGNAKRAMDAEPNAPIPLMSEETRISMRVKAVKQARTRLDEAFADVGEKLRELEHAKHMLKRDLDEIGVGLVVELEPLPEEMEAFLQAQSEWVDEEPERTDA